MCANETTVTPMNSARATNREHAGDEHGSPVAARKGLAVTLNEIYERAYQKWVAAGRPTGGGIQFWLQAEQELQPEP